MAPRIDGPSPSSIQDVTDFGQGSTSVQSGKLRDEGTVTADSDDGPHAGKTTDKDNSSAPKLYGDPLDAGAMKSKLDAAQGGSAKTKVVSSNKSKDGDKLPADEQAIKDKFGDQALEGYQQAKEATSKLSQNVHDTLVGKIGQDMKDLDNLRKKLEANPSDPRTQIEFQQKLNQVQKELHDVNNDPISKAQGNLRKVEQQLQQQNEEEVNQVAATIPMCCLQPDSDAFVQRLRCEPVNGSVGSLSPC